MQNSLATAREILLHEVGSGTALQIFHLAVLAGEKTTGQREVTHHADLLFLCQIRQLRFKIIPIMQVDRKSTRLNSSHVANSYAFFCLKKNKILILYIH